MEVLRCSINHWTKVKLVIIWDVLFVVSNVRMWNVEWFFVPLVPQKRTKNAELRLKFIPFFYDYLIIDILKDVTPL